MDQDFHAVRNARPPEFSDIGKLMVRVYSQLDGFPKETEQPNYYKMLANVGELTSKPKLSYWSPLLTTTKYWELLFTLATCGIMALEERPHRNKIHRGFDCW